MEAQEKWQLVFLIAVGIHIFDVIFYAIFASGDTQNWAKTGTVLPYQKDKNDVTLKYGSSS